MAVYKFYNDANFIEGDSPVTHDIETDLGRKATQGFFHNYGSGTCTFAISTDGTTFGDEIVMTAGDTVGFGGGTRLAEAIVPISKIRVTWVGNTSYKIFVN